MLQPSEWQHCRLRELTRRTATWNPKREVRDQIRYVDVSGVDRATLQIVSETRHSMADAPSRARKIVQAGDTIFATVRPTLRRIAQVPTAMNGEIVSTAFCVLRADPGKIDAEYLFFTTQLASVLSGISALETGASYPAVRDSDVLDQTVPVPPLPEQRKIAGTLKLARSTLLHELRCEAEAIDLKRAAMQTLFTRGLRDEPQKATEIGSIPEGWELSTLGAVSSIERGRFLHRPRNEPRFFGGETPFVQTGDVVRSAGRIREFSQSLNADGVAISRVFPAGTILITIAANIGYTGILQFDSACPDSLVAITPRATMDTEFLEYWLQTQQGAMDRAAPKGTQKNINIQFLLPWPVVIPPLDEQHKIVAILDIIDRKIDLHRRKRVVLSDLFQALLHKLMTGEIRVDQLDLAAISSATPKEAAV